MATMRELMLLRAVDTDGTPCEGAAYRVELRQPDGLTQVLHEGRLDEGGRASERRELEVDEAGTMLVMVNAPGMVPVTAALVVKTLEANVARLVCQWLIMYPLPRRPFGG